MARDILDMHSRELMVANVAGWMRASTNKIEQSPVGEAGLVVSWVYGPHPREFQRPEQERMLAWTIYLFCILSRLKHGNQ